MGTGSRSHVNVVWLQLYDVDGGAGPGALQLDKQSDWFKPLVAGSHVYFVCPFSLKKDLQW